MPRRLFSLPFLVAAVAALAFPQVPRAEEPTPEADAGAYRVRIVRPLKVGSIFSYAALGTTRELTRVTWAGGILEERKRSQQCELAATAEVREVDAAGTPVRTVYRVHRCKGRDENLAETELVPKDTEIEVIADALGLRFRIGGQPITEELHAALSLVLARPVPDDDRIFGSENPRRPGDSARTAITALRASSTVRISANSTDWNPLPIARIAWWVYSPCSILIIPATPASSKARPRLSRSCIENGAYSAANSM